MSPRKPRNRQTQPSLPRERQQRPPRFETQNQPVYDNMPQIFYPEIGVKRGQARNQVGLSQPSWGTQVREDEGSDKL